jgi:dynein-related subfamily AAA family protein
MAHTETHTVTFARLMERAIQGRSYSNSVAALLSAISSKSLTVRGWSFEEVPDSLAEVETDEDGKLYRWEMRISFAHGSNVPDRNEFAAILFRLHGRAMTPAFGKWTLVYVDGNEYQPPTDDETITSKIEKDMVGYADCEIPDEWEKHFEHLYGLDAQVSRVRSALAAAITSSFRNRFHAVLVGPPGCGKSDIAESVRAALGEDAVMRIDATAMTAAGLIKELNERDILPRVIVFEEIEKAPEGALQPLLGVLDTRGEVRKVTARGNVQRDTRVLAIATVNNFGLFEKLQAGALASRFANRIFFKRPTRDVLAMILHREVSKIAGNPDWVIPALDYCEQRKIDDPREVIAICLCGGDDLLTGEYQTMLDATSKPLD